MQRKTRLAVLAAGQDDSRPTVDEDMPTGYQDAHFEAVVYDIGENVRDNDLRAKFKLSSSLTLLNLSTLLHLKASKCYRPVLWTTLGSRALSPWTTDEYHTTMATNRLIDVVATRRKHSLLESISIELFPILSRTSLCWLIRLASGKTRKLQLEEIQPCCGE